MAGQNKELFGPKWSPLPGADDEADDATSLDATSSDDDESGESESEGTGGEVALPEDVDREDSSTPRQPPNARQLRFDTDDDDGEQLSTSTPSNELPYEHDSTPQDDKGGLESPISSSSADSSSDGGDPALDEPLQDEAEQHVEAEVPSDSSSDGGDPEIGEFLQLEAEVPSDSSSDGGDPALDEPLQDEAEVSYDSSSDSGDSALDEPLQDEAEQQVEAEVPSDSSSDSGEPALDEPLQDEAEVPNDSSSDGGDTEIGEPLQPEAQVPNEDMLEVETPPPPDLSEETPRAKQGSELRRSARKPARKTTPSVGKKRPALAAASEAPPTGRTTASPSAAQPTPPVSPIHTAQAMPAPAARRRGRPRKKPQSPKLEPSRGPSQEPSDGSSEQDGGLVNRSTDRGANRLPTKFTPDELQRLAEAVDQFCLAYGKTEDQVKRMIHERPNAGDELHKELWTRLTGTCPGRPRKKVIDRCRRMFHNYVGRGVFTEEQDAELVEMVNEHGQLWAKIGHLVNRHPVDLQKRWHDRLQYGDGLKKNHWDAKEEHRLIGLVVKYMATIQEARGGELDRISSSAERLLHWQGISLEMGSRSAAQCRGKWNMLRRTRERFSAGHETAVFEPSPRKEMADTAVKSSAKWHRMRVQDKRVLVRAIFDSEATSEEKIPWHKLVNQNFRNKWTRPTIMLAWDRLKRTVPRFNSLSVQDICTSLLEHWQRYKSFGDHLDGGAAAESPQGSSSQTSYNQTSYSQTSYSQTSYSQLLPRSATERSEEVSDSEGGDNNESRREGETVDALSPVASAESSDREDGPLEASEADSEIDDNLVYTPIAQQLNGMARADFGRAVNGVARRAGSSPDLSAPRARGKRSATPETSVNADTFRAVKKKRVSFGDEPESSQATPTQASSNGVQDGSGNGGAQKRRSAKSRLHMLMSQ